MVDLVMATGYCVPEALVLCEHQLVTLVTLRVCILLGSFRDAISVVVVSADRLVSRTSMLSSMWHGAVGVDLLLFKLVFFSQNLQLPD